ncbi:MAG: hypothetical protein KAX20_08055 [Candidatus Omnitrophica bacterium]|nr:hypothetical protein [Candidatus Omnitrophota bacterium]
MKFKKEILKGLANEDYDRDVFDIIKDELIDTSRWSNIYEMVFRDKASEKLYLSSYSRGATESQDERPYEYSSEEVEVIEVEEYQETVTKYRKVT